MNFSIVLAITFIITLIYYKDLINLVTLKTLKVLKTLTDLKALTALPPSGPNMTISTKLNMTIAQSKEFIMSEKYSLKPIPTCFKTISIVKITVNHKLTLFKKASPSESTRPSAAKTKVFKNTQSIKKLSKMEDVAKSLINLLIIEANPKIPLM